MREGVSLVSVASEERIGSSSRTSPTPDPPHPRYPTPANAWGSYMPARRDTHAKHKIPSAGHFLRALGRAGAAFPLVPPYIGRGSLHLPCSADTQRARLPRGTTV
jgi:hypothetical protein